MNSETVNPLVSEPLPRNWFIFLAIGVSVFAHLILLNQNISPSLAHDEMAQSTPSAILSLNLINQVPSAEIPELSSENSPKTIDSPKIVEKSNPQQTIPDKQVITSSTQSTTSVSNENPKSLANIVNEMASQQRPPANTVTQQTETAEPNKTTPDKASSPPIPVKAEPAPLTEPNIKLAEKGEADVKAVEKQESNSAEKIAFALPSFNGPVPVAITPDLAKRKRQFGRVVLRGFVNEIGVLEQVDVFQSSGYELLDESAIDQARTWVYKPAFQNLIATGHWVEIPIEFR